MHDSVKECITKYVDDIFDEESFGTHEEIGRFGEAMKHSETRFVFARELDARRSSCLLSVTTYHKLLHSVALALFESSVEENYTAGNILMNMAFTYHYYPKGCYAVVKDELNTQKAALIEESNMCTITSKCQQCIKNLLKCLDPTSKKNVTTLDDRSICLAPHNVKIYLYQSLKRHPIWRSLRFWEEIFFVAVGYERRKRYTTKSWSKLNRDEREALNRAIGNITFGQMTSFLNNMKLLELSRPFRLEFFKKQCEIGGIRKDTDMYSILQELV